MRLARAVAAGSLALVIGLGAAGCAVASVTTVEGLVIEVTGSSPTEVERFSLRTADGRILELDVRGVAFGHDGFPASHLREHQALAEPVRVTYRDEGGRLLVVRLEDAG